METAFLLPKRPVNHDLNRSIPGSSMKDILGSKRPGRSLRAEILLDGKDWSWTLSETAPLFGEDWMTRVTYEGDELTPTSAWREVCRFDDRQVRHREYERRLIGGVRHQRQVTLCPLDNVIVLAEAFLSPRSRTWEYESRLELAPGVSLHPAAETQEFELIAGASRGLILPLALPEWKTAGQTSGLVHEENHLVARYKVVGRSFFFPLSLVLSKRDEESVDQTQSPRHSVHGQTPPFTWRQLTVSECLRRVAPDEAVGFRMQVEHRQWLLYRSLTRPANRAVLGHNLISESLFARFTAQGRVIPLVEVELDEEADSDNGAADDNRGK